MTIQQSEIPVINKLQSDNVHNADITAVCQIIKHYREITSIPYGITFKSSINNTYSPYVIEKIVCRNNTFEITVHQPALLGVRGKLPRMLNTPISHDCHNGDSAGVDFMQLFESRYYALALTAHNKYNLIRQKEEESFSHRNAQYKISDLLGAFLGVPTSFQFKYLNKQTLIRFAAFLGGQAKNVATLLKLLRAYFGYEFTAQYAPMQKRLLSTRVLSQLSSKEKKNNCLGHNVQLGFAVHMFGNFVQIKILVHSKEQYEHMINTPNLFLAMHELITFYFADHNAYTLSMVVQQSYLPNLRQQATSFFRRLQRSNSSSVATHRLYLGQNICLCSSAKDFPVEIPIKVHKDTGRSRK